MSGSEQRRYIILAVILVVFSVIAFAVPFVKNGVFWFAYLFGVIAIVFQIYVFKAAFADGADIKSKFYGFPIARVGVIYLVMQMVLSLVQMLAAGYMKTWMAAVINIIPIGLAVIGTIAADVMREEAIVQDNIVRTNTLNMKNLQTLSAALPSLTDDVEMKKKLEQLAEEFRYSDPVSSEDTVVLEDELLSQLDHLKNALKGNDGGNIDPIYSAITVALNERNRVCRQSK